MLHVREGSVTYTRKVNLGNFENEDFSVTLPVVITGDGDIDTEEIHQTFKQAKLMVLRECPLHVQRAAGVTLTEAGVDLDEGEHDNLWSRR